MSIRHDTTAPRSSLWNADHIGTFDTTSLHIDLDVSGAHTIDRDDGATHDLTLTGDATLTPDATTVVPGETIDLRVGLRQDGVGDHTATWVGTIAWETPDGLAPTMPTDPDALLVVGLTSWDDATTWIGFVADSGTGTGDITTDPAWTAAGDLIVADGDDSAVILPVGDEDDVLTVVSGAPAWSPPASGVTAAVLMALGVVGPIVMSEGITDPPEPVWTEDGTDYIYGELT